MIELDKTYLTEKFKYLKDVVPPRTSAAPESILVDGKLLIADSFELGIATKIDTENTDRFLLPVKAIDFIGSLPPGTVRIKGGEKTVTVESDAGKSRFSTVPPDQFMQLNPFTEDGGTGFELDAEAFAAAVSGVLYACDQNNANDLAKGVYLHGDGENLNVVAMDGYRMGWCAIPYAMPIKTIIPKNAIRKLLSLKLNGGLALSYGKNRAIFNCGDYTISVKTICKDYVNYRGLFAKDGALALWVNAKLLFDAVNRAQICSAGYHSPITFEREAEAGILKLQTLSPAAAYQSDVPVSAADGKPLRFGANAAYVMDALKPFGDEDVTMEWTAPTAAVVFRRENLQALVLPVRVKE